MDGHFKSVDTCLDGGTTNPMHGSCLGGRYLKNNRLGRCDTQTTFLSPFVLERHITMAQQYKVDILILTLEILPE